MAAEWNAERVLVLAPDAPSAKAGQGLGTPKKWASLGRGEGLIWGECQGSGKDPYQAKVDPDEPAFSCSCPSRKFPCKHALGLMLVWAANPGALAEASLPPWVVSWRENRTKRAEAKKEKAERGPAPVDVAAQAKREAARIAKVAAGLDDLQLWLSDLVRQGFSTLGAKSAKLWDDQARRMVDAQAPGLARRLRQVDDMAFSGDGWQADLLDRLGRMHLLIEGFRRRDALPADVADDLRAAIGFPNDLDAVRDGSGLRDRWDVIGHAFAMEEKVLVRRTWLLGRESGRPALLLDFAAGGKPLEPGLSPGTTVEADLAFFPGALALRALVKERHATPETIDRPPDGTSIAEAFAAYGEALARNPWLELWPVALAGVTLREDEGAWSVCDAGGSTLPLSRRFSMGWPLLALTGGEPFHLFGEFDGATLAALGASVGGRFVTLVTSQMHPLETLSVAPPVATPLMADATASAVVGIDRRPPPSPTEGVLAGALRGVEAREPAARLLALAAADGLHGRAGRKPLATASPAPEPCPPETQAECSAEAAGRMRAMLGGEHAPVLTEWLSLLAASGRRVPHDAIIDLLERQPNYNWPIEPLVRTLGTRGRWLAGRNPRWRKFAGLDERDDRIAAWETGDRHRRIAALRALRAADPTRAAELVAASFANEPADLRAAIVEEYGPGLAMADEPFLEASLDDRNVRVRAAAASLLRKLPESRFCGRMIERAKGLLSWKSGLLGLGKRTLVVTPPAECDKAMVRDGITAKPNKPGVGQRGVWLEEVLRNVPPAAVASILNAAPREIVRASRGHEWQEPLRGAWVVATAAHRDVEWAEAILDPTTPGWTDRTWESPFVREIFTSMPKDRREALFTRLLDNPKPFPCPKHPATILVQWLEPPIDRSLARQILARVRELVDAEWREFKSTHPRELKGQRIDWEYDSSYHDEHMGDMIESLQAILPPDLADEAGQGFDLDPSHDEPCYAVYFAEMLERLRFRRDMHRELAP